MATITITKLTKVFPNAVRAVDNFSLSIEDGEFVSLLGPSGCGKTTTLRMLAGLEDPTEGQICLDDTFLYHSGTGAYVPTEKRQMGLVFQSYALWPHMTVTGNIAFGLVMHHVPKAEQRQRIADVFKLLQIEGLEKRYSFQISGGQQQRVALARMLALRPNVLLLDEPLSNLDARLRIEMRTELKRLHERLKTTTVFVTHDQLEAMTMSTRIAVMSQGELQQYGTPMDIYRHPANLFVAKFVGSPPINVLEKDEENGLFASAREYLLGTGGRSEAGEARHLAFRPEAVRIGSSEAPAEGLWQSRAAVAAILPTGPEWIVQTQVGNTLIFCREDSQPTYSTGDNCTITVEPSAFHIFDDQGRTLVPEGHAE